MFDCSYLDLRRVPPLAPLLRPAIPGLPFPDLMSNPGYLDCYLQDVGTVLRIAMLLGYLLSGMVHAQPPPGSRTANTVVDMGTVGSIRLEGRWSVIRRDTLLHSHAVSLLAADSTRFTVRKDARVVFVDHSDGLTPQEFVDEYYETMELYTNGLSHWSCWAVQSKVEDFGRKKNCIMWQLVDRCGGDTWGLYGADDEFLYRFSISSPIWTATEQQLYLIYTFEGNVP